MEELEPNVIDKYLSQYDELVSKRRSKKDEINKWELDVAKNKTTLVTLRDRLNKSEEDVRIFEGIALRNPAATGERRTGARVSGKRCHEQNSSTED